MPVPAPAPSLLSPSPEPITVSINTTPTDSSSVARSASIAGSPYGPEYWLGPSTVWACTWPVPEEADDPGFTAFVTLQPITAASRPPTAARAPARRRRRSGRSRSSGTDSVFVAAMPTMTLPPAVVHPCSTCDVAVSTPSDQCGGEPHEVVEVPLLAWPL